MKTPIKVNKKTKNGITRAEYYEEIVLDNIKTAKNIYNINLNNLMTWEYSKNYSGRVELFEPHIFDDGTFAYWPANGEYIKQESINL